MSTTRLEQFVRADPMAVYRALTTAEAVRMWMVPDGMTSEVHVFDAREGGLYRISLTYKDTDNAGKSSAYTDTHGGRFVTLTPGKLVEMTSQFESDDPAMQGEMRLIFRLIAKDDGTLIDATHDNVPDSIAPADNETGWRMSLGKLAKLVETQ